MTFLKKCAYNKNIAFLNFLFLFNKDKRIPCESDTFVSSVLSSIKSYNSPLSSTSADKDDSHWETLSEFDKELFSSLLMVVSFPHLLL